MKRFVAAILAIVMLLSTFSFTALAAAPEQLPQTDPTRRTFSAALRMT